MSERWLSEDRGTDVVLQGYELHCINKGNKGGGGVALFVDEGLTYKVVNNMSVITDDVMECVTIEICMKKVKNVIVSCVYRTPGSNTEILMENMETC